MIKTLLVSLGLLFTMWVVGQSTDHMSLTTALNSYQERNEIKFSYDPELLEQIAMPRGLDTLSPANFIGFIENQYPLKVSQVQDAYYTIALTERLYSISISDSVDGKTIAPSQATALVNGQPIASTVSANRLDFLYKPNPTDQVEIYALGYIRKPISFEQLINSRSVVLSLHPQIIELRGVIIEDYLTKGINMNPSNQSISIKVSDLPLLPGETDGDIFASLAALPGITTPDNRPGNLFIRGSSTDQSLILFNDIPIYHRGHYYGTISPYNPKMVDDVKVYRNGFHPKMGGRVGGALEINSTDEPQKNLNAGIGSNTLYGMGYAKLPSKNKKTGFSIGARRSYPYSFSSPKLRSISQMVFAGSALLDSAGNLQEDIDVLFEDYVGKITHQVNDNNLLTLTSVYSRSDVAYKVSQKNSDESNRIENLGLNLKWKSVINSRLVSRFSATSSDYRFAFRNLITPPKSANLRSLEIYSTNELTDFRIREEFSLDMEQGNRLQFGVDYKYQNAYFDYQDIPVRDTIVQTRGADQYAHTASPFVNFEWNSSKKLYVQLGARANYYSKLNDLKVAPRIFINYFANKQLTVKGSAGWYYQYLSQVKVLEFSGGGFDNELWLLADNKDTRIINGFQSMAGAILNLKSWIIDLEGYYKTADNISYYSAGRFSSRGEFYFASHLIYGADLLIKKQLSSNASAWVGYSWAESKIMVDTISDTRFESQFSQPHVFYVGGSLQHEGWKFSLGWNYASGQYARSFRVSEAETSYYRFVNQLPPDAPRPIDSYTDLEDRYPAVHTLNLSASYQLPKTEDRKWSSTFGISLINVYNQQNLTDKAVRAGRPTAFLVDRYAIGFAPNLMITVEW
ncbi:TonB-dependent receptor plug domain-containing protein [Marinoscillum luteum]|uniref:TonB-dependent receptor plug domain-containing protein n=1 Tax=Marinoscillum luteum TaxID=861051 RepID=A0ABW7NEF2_9BACT